MSKLILGFTGTQEGMTSRQKRKFLELLNLVKPAEFHHGDCIGADSEAHDIVRSWNPRCFIIIHPPTVRAKRAFKNGDIVLQPYPYLERNQHIVNASHVLVATPKEMCEVMRSGTWATIRRARKRGIKICRINPMEGSV